jgi:uncharacterized membrane-anchored protein YhcB (DUF1043 family)
VGLTPEQYSIIGLLVTALLGVLTGRWYTALSYNQMRTEMTVRLDAKTAECDEWKKQAAEWQAIALEGLRNNAKALSLVERTATSP